ncbi:MAG TPA: excinuclease ABC subunit UvrC, partial [Bdellovibrionales bacterium]|nr:excinuclease ABC subunit UvrC [Bdellovibrionales bacterium]
RVRSYLTESKDLSVKTRFLVGQIAKIEYMRTRTEVEAFLVEASLIKKHRPKYNIRLKDDKSYPYIRVSMFEPFPRLYLARKVKKDGSLYFGPFTSGWVVHQTIRVLNQLFQIRDCSDHFMAKRKRPCMTHQIGRCTAPCVNLVTSEAYKEEIKSAVMFLRGRDKSVIDMLESRMKTAAADEKYEVAARMRDGIKALQSVLEKQIVVNDQSGKDQDIIGFLGDERGSLIETLHIRGGRVVGTRPHFIAHLNVTSPDEDPRDWLTEFLNQYYEENFVPDEVVLPITLGDDLMKLLSAVLEERRGSPVKVRHAMDAKGAKLLDMVDANAREHFKVHVEKSDRKQKGLEDIQKKFELPELPTRIECYDISHFQGQETVASQVVFEDGVPAKDHYRLYKLRTVSQADDYASMKEVLERRLKHTEYDDPQLILVDGGKGQLKMAVEVLRELGRTDIPVASLAKARTQGEFSDKEVEATQERFYLPNRVGHITFLPNSEAFRILVSLRDEAHRFAIGYHRKLRENSSLEGELDLVHGLGDVRKKKLLEHFGSVEDLKKASAEEIAKIEGFSTKLAQQVLDQIRETETDLANIAAEK